MNYSDVVHHFIAEKYFKVNFKQTYLIAEKVDFLILGTSKQNVFRFGLFVIALRILFIAKFNCSRV